MCTDLFTLITFAISSIADFKEGPKDACDTNFKNEHVKQVKAKSKLFNSYIKILRKKPPFEIHEASGNLIEICCKFQSSKRNIYWNIQLIFSGYKCASSFIWFS